MFEDIMVDLETLGTTPGSVVLSVGAVRFNLETGEIGPRFIQKIDLQDSLDRGFKIEAGTLQWWATQDQRLFQETIANGDGVSESISYLLDWFRSIKDPKVWGNSNRFDLGILEPYFTELGVSVPWGFRNERDVRTLVSFAPEIKDNEEFAGVMHDPIDDCIHQINYCHKIWKKING